MKTNVLDHTLLDRDATVRSGLLGALSGFVSSIRRAAADRALHRQLADMDDVMLRDIGLADDEIYRLRHGGSVTPRNWM